MSIWNGVKRAFGFETEAEEDDVVAEYDSSLPTYAAAPAPTPVPAPVPVAPAAPAPQVAPRPAEGNSDLAGDLFDAVIEVFNSAQPDFVKKCLSTEAQRQYILNSLSEGLKRRLEATTTKPEAAEKPEKADKPDRTEELTQENRKLKLSLDRQKRALLDRINDLEAQVAKLQADKERYYTKHPEKAPENEEQLTALQAEVQRQTTLREQAEFKSRMADEIISELRNSEASLRQDLDQAHAEQEEAMATMTEKIQEFDSLKARLENRIAELQKTLKEQRDDDLPGQISKLKEENATLHTTIENNLYNQANSELRLRKEIKALKAQLEAGTEAPAAEPEPPAYAPEAQPNRGEAEAEHKGNEPQAPQKRKRGRPRKRPLDVDLSDADYFAPTSDKAKGEADDFGYHEPPRRHSNDNEAQLSLF